MADEAMQAKRATYEDLLQVPDTKVAEIVDGELVVSPRPAIPHIVAATVITGDLVPAFHGTEALTGPGGWWILSEPELHLADDVLVPDLAAYRCERLRIPPNAPAFTVSPDWICEITSPSSVRHDRIAKIRCYAREGVKWVWLVDPLAQTLEARRLDGAYWTIVALHAGDEVVRVEPFAEVELRLRRWWPS
jgi:Uma2 family endonuclease